MGGLYNGSTSSIESVRLYYLDSYALTITKTGAGAGTVTSNPTGISCGVDCSEQYDPGTSVVLTATADTGSTFSGWSGHADCADGSVTMDADTTCTATFTLNQYTLTVNTNPTGTGSGTVSGGGTYNYGTTIQLTATASPGSIFTGWSGGVNCSGTDNPLSVIIDSNTTCTANFDLQYKFPWPMFLPAITKGIP